MLPVGGAVTALGLLGARTHAASLPAGRQLFVQQGPGKLNRLCCPEILEG